MEKNDICNTISYKDQTNDFLAMLPAEACCTDTAMRHRQVFLKETLLALSDQLHEKKSLS